MFDNFACQHEFYGSYRHCKNDLEKITLHQLNKQANMKRVMWVSPSAPVRDDHDGIQVNMVYTLKWPCNYFQTNLEFQNITNFPSILSKKRFCFKEYLSKFERFEPYDHFNGKYN